MHVRARLRRRRLQISLIDTRRVDGKVRQEHIALLGSVPPAMTPADRLAFWTPVHPRLALDQAALSGKLHTKVPMVASGDPGLTADKIEIAAHNARTWDQGAGAYAGRKQAADAAGHAAEDRRKVKRLKAGKDVDVGKPINLHAILKATGVS
jgi:hypothetical protein